MNTNHANGITVDFGNSDSGKKLQQNLSNEETLKAFNSIVERIGTLEKAVLNLTTMLERGPGLVSMTMDMVDEGVKNAAKDGVYIEQRLGAALEIAEKLTAPAMVEKLNGLLEMANQAPGLISMTMDMVDEGVKNAAKDGVYIEQRLGAALEIAEKLTAPAMVEKLNGLLEMANQAPGLISMTMDMIDETVSNAAKKGIYIDERGKLLMEAAEKLTSPTMLANLNGLIELSHQAPGLIAMAMDTLDDEYKRMSREVNIPAVTNFLGNTVKALSNATSSEPTKIGLFGMMRALNDPDRQKALGFLMELTKQLGKQM